MSEGSKSPTDMDVKRTLSIEEVADLLTSQEQEVHNYNNLYDIS